MLTSRHLNKSQSGYRIQALKAMGQDKPYHVPLLPFLKAFEDVYHAFYSKKFAWPMPGATVQIGAKPSTPPEIRLSDQNLHPEDALGRDMLYRMMRDQFLSKNGSSTALSRIGTGSSVGSSADPLYGLKTPGFTDRLAPGSGYYNTAARPEPSRTGTSGSFFNRDDDDFEDGYMNREWDLPSTTAGWVTSSCVCEPCSFTDSRICSVPLSTTFRKTPTSKLPYKASA